MRPYNSESINTQTLPYDLNVYFIFLPSITLTLPLLPKRMHATPQALADVRELLEDGLLRESEVLAIWKAVPKADAAGDRVDLVGFCEAFARVDALFEEEEEEEGSAGVAEAGVVGSAVGGGGVAVEAGEAEASFLELVGSAEGVLDLAGLLR